MRYIPDENLTKEMVHLSMLNGYMYLIKGESISKAYERNQTEQIYYPFNVDLGVELKDIKSMIEHFANDSIQDFEKCIELKKLYDKHSDRYCNNEIKKNEL